MKIYLPWLGEFGTEVLRYVPLVHADQGPKLVFCEEGKEALYPEGENLRVIPKIKETERKCAGSTNQNVIWDQIKTEYGEEYVYVHPASTIRYSTKGYFHPKPLNPYDISTDIVIFPRWRHNTKRMNWPYWEKLVDILTHSGYSVFAAGTKDMSFELNCPCAWDYDRELDASICAIENSKIRIGLITALDLICMLCGKPPWVLLTEEGMKSIIGRDVANLSYLWQTDIHDVGWKILPYWNEPYKILNEVNHVFNRNTGI